MNDKAVGEEISIPAEEFPLLAGEMLSKHERMLARLGGHVVALNNAIAVLIADAPRPENTARHLASQPAQRFGRRSGRKAVLSRRVSRRFSGGDGACEQVLRTSGRQELSACANSPSEKRTTTFTTSPAMSGGLAQWSRRRSCFGRALPFRGRSVLVGYVRRHWDEQLWPFSLELQLPQFGDGGVLSPLGNSSSGNTKKIGQGCVGVHLQDCPDLRLRKLTAHWPDTLRPLSVVVKPSKQIGC